MNKKLEKEENKSYLSPFQTNCHRYLHELLQQPVEVRRAVHAASTEQQHLHH
jgi:hypothetical protein